MRGLVRSAGALLFVIMLAPGASEAQPVLGARCAGDPLHPTMVEARLQWARRCALRRHVMNPAAWFDTFVPSSNGAGTLKDYAEDTTATNPLGRDRYISQVFNFEANTATTTLLYQSGMTSQHLDADGYHRWERPANRKKSNPLYPTFGVVPDIYAPTNYPLYPHPWDPLDCDLYLDTGGIVRAIGLVDAFYVVAYCDPAQSAFADDERDSLNRQLIYKTVPPELIP